MSRVPRAGGNGGYRTRALVAGVGVAALALVAAGCGGSGDGAPPSSTSTSSPVGATPPAGASSTTTTAATGTTTVDFNPFDSAGPIRSVTVVFRTTGDCGEQSQADPGRSGAFRCLLDRAGPGGERTTDPCFNDPFGTQSSPLLCFTTPTDLRAVEVTPDGPLPSPNSPSGDPWVLRLANGATCVYTAGSGATGDGAHLTYRCAGDAVVYGDPDTSSSFWTVSYAPTAAGATTAVQVDTAWY